MIENCCLDERTNLVDVWEYIRMALLPSDTVDWPVDCYKTLRLGYCRRRDELLLSNPKVPLYVCKEREWVRERKDKWMRNGAKSLINIQIYKVQRYKYTIYNTDLLYKPRWIGYTNDILYLYTNQPIRVHLALLPAKEMLMLMMMLLIDIHLIYNISVFHPLVLVFRYYLMYRW